MRWKRHGRKIGLTTLVVLLVGVACTSISIPPVGRFSTPDIGCTADSYFEFSDGRIWHVMFDGEKSREGDEHRQHIGRVEKLGSNWVVDAGDGRPTTLRSTVLFLELGRKNDGPARCYRYWKFGNANSRHVIEN